jgi:glycosyltransferase involved in cell wall biosynthesis
MEESRKLSIVIPTYNRPDILLENLEVMRPELAKYQVKVHISDDSTDDETERRIKAFSATYPLVAYARNNPRLGHDSNCKRSLFWPETEYVWYLGDSMRIESGGIARAFEALSGGPAFIFLNCVSSGLEMESGEIRDLGEFLRRATWYLTLSGATIYSRRVLDWCGANHAEQRYDNFQQLGYILAYASKNDDDAYWVYERAISVNGRKKSYWGANVLKVFGHDWVSLIERYSDYFGATELGGVLKSHSVNHRMFSFRSLVSLRAENGINMKAIKENEASLRKVSRFGLLPLYLSLIIPVGLASSIKRAAKRRPPSPRS